MACFVYFFLLTPNNTHWNLKKKKSGLLLHSREPYLFIFVWIFDSVQCLTSSPNVVLINKFSRVIDTNTVHCEHFFFLSFNTTRHDTIRCHRTQNTQWIWRRMRKKKKQQHLKWWFRFSRIICLLCQRFENQQIGQ